MIPEEDLDNREAGYLIQIGNEYILNRTDVGGRTYYKIKFVKRLPNGEPLEGYKSVKLASKTLNTNVADGTIIVPKNFFEDFYFAKNDKMHYNAVWQVVITDWELRENREAVKEEAYDDYNAMLQSYQGIDLPF